MNGATQKIEQLESDRINVTELIQVKICRGFDGRMFISIDCSKLWMA